MTLADYLRRELADVADNEVKSIALTGGEWRQIIDILETPNLYAEVDAEIAAEFERLEAEWNDPVAVEKRRVESREKRKAYEARRKARG